MDNAGIDDDIDIRQMSSGHLKSLHRAFKDVTGEQRFFIRAAPPSRHFLGGLLKEAKKRNLPFWIALHQTRVVGWIYIAFPALPALAHSGTLTMGVLAPYRRQYIGTRLLAAAVSHAFTDASRSRVQLEVIGDNTAAIALYQHHGFHVEGIARDAVKVNGVLKDICHMARLREG